MFKITLGILVLYNVLFVNGLTENITTELCLGIPSLPFRVIGITVLSTPEKGRKICYYAPKTSEHYFRIRVNKLNLKKIRNECPKFRLQIYNKEKTEYADENDADIQISWKVPESPQTIFEADCTNYEKKMGEIFDSKQPGYKIELDYNPGNEQAPSDAFDFTLSSYLIGQSYSCPGKSHLCTSTSHVCLDESLACDNSDNCYDSSDEDDYKCTGRIGNLPMPLFVIIIIGCVLFLIFLIMIIILLMRGYRDRKMKKKKEWRNFGRNYDESIMRSSYLS